MNRTSAFTFCLLAGLAVSACSRAAGGSPPAQAPTPNQVSAPAALPHTAADVEFMAGMIPHHAQAVRMAGWVGQRSQNPSLRVLAERIVVGQKDEIDLMQNWLRDRNERVPAANATHHTMVHDGVQHQMLMPGMLTDEELAQLERSRGAEFDRLFLTYMIRHHEGAVSMVDQLFNSPGAGQDEMVFRLASDIYADQTTEIDRMQKMLAMVPAR